MVSISFYYSQLFAFSSSLSLYLRCRSLWIVFSPAILRLSHVAKSVKETGHLKVTALDPWPKRQGESISQFQPLILGDVLISLAWFMFPPLRQIKSHYCPAWVICLPTPVPGYTVSISEECGVELLLHIKWVSQLKGSLQKGFCADIYWRNFKIKLQDCSEPYIW